MNTPANRNLGVLKTAGVVVACAFLFGFAMVPLYRVVCEHVLGIKLAAGAVDQSRAAGLVEDSTRSVRVQFIASVNSRLPWVFAPEMPSVEVHPGKLTEVWFDATNTGARRSSAMPFRASRRAPRRRTTTRPNASALPSRCSRQASRAACRCASSSTRSCPKTCAS
jgi:cytochrome c oxidase assembly protein Cox11